MSPQYARIPIGHMRTREPGADEVHVWMASLDRGASELAALWEILAEDEQARAARYRFETDRQRFIVARGILRCLLGHYVGAAASDIIFRYGSAGKPSVAAPATTLQFNLSHTGEWALYAIGRDRALGIDIELFRDTVPWPQLAPLVFSLSEQSELDLYPKTERPAAFLRGWTRKEAYIKARGEGLSLPLDRFDVLLGFAQAPMLVNTARDRGTTRRWWLHPIESLTGCIAALVVEGEPATLTCRRWPGLGTNIGLAA